MGPAPAAGLLPALLPAAAAALPAVPPLCLRTPDAPAPGPLPPHPLSSSHADSADDQRDGAPTSDGTGAPCRCSWCCVSLTPSGVRLGTWLGSAACPWRTCADTIILVRIGASNRQPCRRTRASRLLRCCCCSWLCADSTAVRVSSGTAETAAGDGVAVLLWPIRRTISVMVRQRATAQGPHVDAAGAVCL